MHQKHRHFTKTHFFVKVNAIKEKILNARKFWDYRCINSFAFKTLYVFYLVLNGLSLVMQKRLFKIRQVVETNQHCHSVSP